MNNKYLKVMFGDKSGADSNLKYKINEVNIATTWNPKASNPREMGGFNFSNEENILRWLVRGDTLYDVEVPKDAEVVKVDNPSTPNGVFRSNKIILSNPRKVTDELAMELYKKSKLPEKSYYKAMIGLAIRGHINTATEVLKDKVNKDNIDLVISEVTDFTTQNSGHNDPFAPSDKESTEKIKEYLNEIKSNLLISLTVDKPIYEKELTKDKIINITGESGSGKSTYTKKYENDENYIIIDTDIVLTDKAEKEYEKDLYKIFKTKYPENTRNLGTEDFDYFYKTVLDYFKNTDKTIVIDSAQFRNIKDITILKGKILIIRTCINNCYQRCVNRYNQNHPNATPLEKEKYKEKKQKMYYWYKSLNEIIKKIDKI